MFNDIKVNKDQWDDLLEELTCLCSLVEVENKRLAVEEQILAQLILMNKKPAVRGVVTLGVPVNQ